LNTDFVRPTLKEAKSEYALNEKLSSQAYLFTLFFQPSTAGERKKQRKNHKNLYVYWQITAFLLHTIILPIFADIFKTKK
jgi:hypothetical protein